MWNVYIETGPSLESNQAPKVWGFGKKKKVSEPELQNQKNQTLKPAPKELQI